MQIKAKSATNLGHGNLTKSLEFEMDAENMPVFINPFIINLEAFKG